MSRPDAGVEKARLGTHNVVASFLGQQKAQEAKNALTQDGVPDGSIVVGSRTDDAHSLKAEMREEVEHSAAGGGIGIHNREQLLGASKGSVIGALVGAFIGFMIGIIFLNMTGAVIATIAFGVGGFVAGAVSGGLSGPRPAEKRRDVHTDARVTVGVHSDDETLAERAVAVLERVGADRIDTFDQEGDPYKEAPEERDWH